MHRYLSNRRFSVRQTLQNLSRPQQGPLFLFFNQVQVHENHAGDKRNNSKRHKREAGCGVEKWAVNWNLVDDYPTRQINPKKQSVKPKSEEQSLQSTQKPTSKKATAKNQAEANDKEAYADFYQYRLQFQRSPRDTARIIESIKALDITDKEKEVRPCGNGLNSSKSKSSHSSQPIIF